MSVANGVAKLKTNTQYPASGPPCAARLSPRPSPPALEEHWLDSSGERAAKLVISPEMAAWLLAERNPRNRRLSSGLVERLTGVLKKGRWQVNGETLIFDWDGNLLNGQHRLTACVKAGTAITTWIIFGIDPEAFTTMDRGKSRNNSDDLGLLGESNTRLLSAVITMIWRDERGAGNGVRSSALYPSPEEALDVLSRHPDLRIVARKMGAKSHLGKLIQARLSAYCFYQFSRIDPQAAERFFEDLSTGVGLEKGDPALMLRNRLINDRASKSRLVPEEVLALVIKAWNARRTGRKVNLLVGWRAAQGEPFPTIR